MWQPVSGSGGLKGPGGKKAEGKNDSFCHFDSFWHSQEHSYLSLELNSGPTLKRATKRPDWKPNWRSLELEGPLAKQSRGSLRHGGEEEEKLLRDSTFHHPSAFLRVREAGSPSGGQRGNQTPNWLSQEFFWTFKSRDQLETYIIKTFPSIKYPNPSASSGIQSSPDREGSWCLMLIYPHQSPHPT